ncbi:MAG: hypothetical protein K2Q26_08895 [Bdellovibrionales bacterium]|nr:hypothetical protein [Bdellovibrionales bacterium]
MVDINRKQLLRLKYLNQLFDEVGGDAGVNIDSLVVGRAVGLDKFEHVNAIIHYLVHEGLINITTMGTHEGGPTIELTHQGIAEIERARTDPHTRTDLFPP